MIEYNKKYPDYNFNKNKGYGTKEHFFAIQQNGICTIHRKSFKGILNK
jgi:ribonuclease HII